MVSVVRAIPRAFRVLEDSGTAVSVSASTDEETLATITVPGNAMGPNGHLRIWTAWAWGSSGNIKTPRVKVGGTLYSSQTPTTTTGAALLTQVRNINDAESQISYGASGLIGLGISSAAIITSSIDTTADFDIELTGQKANSGDTLTLQSYCVELLAG